MSDDAKRKFLLSEEFETTVPLWYFQVNEISKTVELAYGKVRFTKAINDNEIVHMKPPRKVNHRLEDLNALKREVFLLRNERRQLEKMFL